MFALRAIAARRLFCRLSTKGFPVGRRQLTPDCVNVATWYARAQMLLEFVGSGDDIFSEQAADIDGVKAAATAAVLASDFNAALLFRSFASFFFAERA